MNPASLDPTQRFSDRAHDYARGRPGYPEAIADTLVAEAGLREGSRVADVASGTGISSELFLRRGCAVYGVEPNPEMRQMAERQLHAYPDFRSVAGTAAATTLPDGCVDFVTVAQAFHWLDPVEARREFSRILRPPGIAALFWNWRRTSGTAFLDAYEAVLTRYGTDYHDVRRRYGVRAPETLRAFFAAPSTTRVFTHAQRRDLDDVTALVLSASYMPGPGHPERGPMLDAIARAFAAHERDGQVEIVYDAELHFGPLVDATVG